MVVVSSNGSPWTARRAAASRLACDGGLDVLRRSDWNVGHVLAGDGGAKLVGLVPGSVRPVAGEVTLARSTTWLAFQRSIAGGARFRSDPVSTRWIARARVAGPRATVLDSSRGLLLGAPATRFGERRSISRPSSKALGLPTHRVLHSRSTRSTSSVTSFNIRHIHRLTARTSPDHR